MLKPAQRDSVESRRKLSGAICIAKAVAKGSARGGVHDARKPRCIVCMEARPEVVFVPCGHLVCCVGCAEQVVSCPSCRAEIAQRVRTYLDD